MGTSIITDQLKKTIQTELLENKTEFLKNELSLLLNRKKYNLCDNYEDFIAISFEYDYPFDFCFVGYPTPELFDNWNETAIINFPQSQTKSISEILLNFYEEQNITQEEFDPSYWPLAKEIYREFFSNCWMRAKTEAKSDKRAFLFEHDIGLGWDCDLSKEINEDNIKVEIEKETGYNM